MNNKVAALYRDFGAMVLRRCIRLLKNEASAFDAMQDVFVQVLLNEKKLDLTNPSSLLYRIATNVCLNKIRDEKKCLSVNSGDEQYKLLVQIANAEDLEAQTVFSSLLSHVFRRVPESSKTIAVLHYVDGLTLSQVAAEVNLSVSGVRKRLKKLTAQLKAIEGIEE